MDFPLLVVAWVQLFILSSRRDDRDITLQSLKHFREKSVGGKLNPALCSIRDDVHAAESLRFDQKIVGYIIQLGKSLLESGRELEIRLVDQMLVRCKEGRTEDSVVPVKNDASLANLRLVLRPKPNLIIGKP